MAEYFVDPVLEKLIDACFDYLKDQIGWKTNVEEELKKLRFIQPQIQAVVSVHSQAQIENPALNKWYWQLRDAVDEANDVLDEIEYWKLEKQVISKNKGKRRPEVPVWNLYENLTSALRIGKYAPKSDPSLKRLEEAVHKLVEISAQVSTFLHLLDRANHHQQQQVELHRTRETGSVIKNFLFGRSKEMESVMNWLRKPYDTRSTDSTDLYRNMSLLSVVGLGGMGKTTLSQHVYKDATLNKDGATDGFDVKMWVCVSHKFDARTVIKSILEPLQKESTHLETLEALQISLQSEVLSKRFLLVLDDIWEDNKSEWKKVLHPLSYGSPVSKILITTQMDTVASMFANIINKRMETVQLKDLEEKEFLQLFNTHAFVGIEDPDDEFIFIAGEIAKKLPRYPLAAKIVGGNLNSYVDKSYWIKVLDTNIENVGSLQNQLLPILKSSYIHLPKFLKNCFAFCCIFPQDHQFDKNDLVRMWIALGFIQSSDFQRDILEDIGRSYFNILVQKYFFDEFHTFEGKVYYKMSDLVYQLAKSVCTQECFRVADGTQLSDVPETIRHLSMNTRTSLEATSQNTEKFKKLRSLFLSSERAVGYDKNVISGILKVSKNIRLLVISGRDLAMELPNMIGCLIHLRYLKVECFGGFEFPRSISQLYHLQFIISKRLQNLEMDNIGWKELKNNDNCQLITDELVIKDPSMLVMLPPRSISSFCSLEIEENDELVSFPIETEQWFLQHHSSLFELKFHNLQSLQSLPSSLKSFSSLETLQVYNVPQLKLLPKLPSSLTTLRLYNLESLLCLPSSLSTIFSLRALILHYIPLLKSFTDLPCSLKNLEIEELGSLQYLPSSLLTISSLTLLKLKNIPLLKSLPDLPSALKELEIEELESLQCLPSLTTISSLTLLIIKNIPLLKSLPDLPSSLKKLELRELESLQCLPSSLSAISSHETLKLINIPHLKSLPDLPSSLKELEIEELESLQCLPSSLSTISSLTLLILKNTPLLKTLPDLPSFLERLELQNLKSMKCLPSSLSAISSLETLKLINIPLLKSLPDLPSSLSYIHLEELENLDCLPSRLPTSLKELIIYEVPRLLKLSDLPASLHRLSIYGCDPQLMERYPNFYRR